VLAVNEPIRIREIQNKSLKNTKAGK